MQLQVSFNRKIGKGSVRLIYSVGIKAVFLLDIAEAAAVFLMD